MAVGLRADEAIGRVVEAAARVQTLVHRGEVVLVAAASPIQEPLASAGVFVEAKPVQVQGVSILAFSSSEKVTEVSVSVVHILSSIDFKMIFPTHT